MAVRFERGLKVKQGLSGNVRRGMTGVFVVVGGISSSCTALPGIAFSFIRMCIK
jgi:hypothetical protein